jgi:hypothetical protein
VHSQIETGSLPTTHRLWAEKPREESEGAR